MVEKKGIRIVWNSPDDLPALYANQLQITHGTETEFHLFFGHLTPPLTHGLTEEELPTKLSINPIAKIIITPDVLKEMISAMDNNYKNYEKKYLKGDIE